MRTPSPQSIQMCMHAHAHMQPQHENMVVREHVKTHTKSQAYHVHAQSHILLHRYTHTICAHTPCSCGTKRWWRERVQHEHAHTHTQSHTHTRTQLRHDKMVEREQAAAAMANSPPNSPPLQHKAVPGTPQQPASAAAATKEVAALYQSRGDLSLKVGIWLLVD